MTERFEQQFYPDPWHRVLPLGPDGIAPYIRPAYGPHMRRGVSDLLRLGMTTSRALGRIAAFGRWLAVGRTSPMLEGSHATASAKGCLTALSSSGKN